MRVATRSSLRADLETLGLKSGDSVLVHAALRKVGPVAGGADMIIAALRDAVGPQGTVLAYADWQGMDVLAQPIQLADGRTVPSLVYLADRAHRQFAGKLPLLEALKHVRQGIGTTGTNIDYVRNTLAHLRELGLRDKGLEELAHRADL